MAERRGVPGLLIALILLLLPGAALALDPSHGVDQLKLTQWGPDQGAPANILGISQSPDGFLWLATSNGLYRFDGVTFERIPPIRGDRKRSTEVYSVLAARDGSVWAGHLWGGLSVYKNGTLQDANHGPPTGVVKNILEAPDGAIWVATTSIKGTQIARYKSGRWTDASVSLGLPQGFLADIRFAHDGTLWVLTSSSLLRLNPGSRRYVSAPNETGLGVLVEAPAGRMLLIGNSGIRELAARPDNNARPTPLISKETYRVIRALFDRDGNLIICSDDRTLRIVRPSSSSRSLTGDVSSDVVTEKLDLGVETPPSLNIGGQGRRHLGRYRQWPD
jgi:ligand-binding sensor domain-containing protein